MSYYHWRCECGAHGNSNELAANALIIGLHQDRGHTVTSWPRGFKHEHAQTFLPTTKASSK